MSTVANRCANNPLASASARMPLARPRWDPPPGTDRASPLGRRPFGLRFASIVAEATAVTVPTWHFDPSRQIAVTADGQPWYRSVTDMTMRTTGATPDGGGGTGGEEWGPDYLCDER